MTSRMIRPATSDSCIMFAQLTFSQDIFFGFRKIYFVFCIIWGRSTACIFSVRYSVTFSLLSFFTAIVKETISLTSRLSSALSKNRTVKNKSHTMMIQRNITATVGLIARIIPDRRSHVSDPSQYVILLRASTRAYSLGLDLESIYA